MNTRFELNGGIVKVTRPLCGLSILTCIQLVTNTRTGTYPQLCVPFQGICSTADADTHGTGVLFVVGGIAWLIFWTVNCGGFGCTLFRKDSYILFVFRAWKRAHTIGVFSRLLPLGLRRGQGDILGLLDVEGDWKW